MRALFLMMLALVWTGAAVAAPSDASRATSVGTFTLKNGLEVVVLEAPQAALVTHMLWYRVGASEDPPGRSGLAHFMEHMMFQGTTEHPPGYFFRTISRLGGEKNAFTTPDFTSFYVDIAKAHLGEVMALEADRMQHLAPPEPAFLKERDVILEERRMRVDAEPGGHLQEELDAALFLHHPYRRPVLGWPAEMERLSREDVLAFHKLYYHPNNAVLILAGNITLAEAKAMTETYYGAIPRGPLPKEPEWDEPPAKANQTLMYRDARVKQPVYQRAWVVPGVKQAGVAKALPYFVLSGLLGEGNSSRLFQSLVVQRHLASEAGTNYMGLTRGPGRFVLWALPVREHGLSTNGRAEFEDALETELTRLAHEGIAEAELARVKTQLKSSAIYSMDEMHGAANLLGELVLLGLPPDYLAQWPRDIDAVTPTQVQDAAKALLAQRSVEAWLLPEKDAAPETKAESEPVPTRRRR